jgi:uncharacterized membrane protein YGL010W
MSKRFDLDHQYVKYAEFHFNPVNEFIHMVFIPLLIFTVQIMASYPQITTVMYIPINPSFIITSLYLIYYIAIWPSVALLFAPVLYAAWYAAIAIAEAPDFYEIPIIYWAIAMYSNLFNSSHGCSWVFQIMGHLVFEGRAPALLKDPAQGKYILLNIAFILAPFFVFCQYIFMYLSNFNFRFGLFKKEKRRLHLKTEKAVMKYRKTLAKLNKLNRKLSDVIDFDNDFVE